MSPRCLETCVFARPDLNRSSQCVPGWRHMSVSRWGPDAMGDSNGISFFLAERDKQKHTLVLTRLRVL